MSKLKPCEQSPENTIKKYTEADMLAAFRHGREYESCSDNGGGDIATKSLPEKNRPFWGWLRLRDVEEKP